MSFTFQFVFLSSGQRIALISEEYHKISIVFRPNTFTNGIIALAGWGFPSLAVSEPKPDTPAPVSAFSAPLSATAGQNDEESKQASPGLLPDSQNTIQPEVSSDSQSGTFSEAEKVWANPLQAGYFSMISSTLLGTPTPSDRINGLVGLRGPAARCKS